MISELNEAINLVKVKLPDDIHISILYDILFEMNRYFDKNFVELLHDSGYRFNQSQRNLLRKYYYYGIEEWLPELNINSFPKYNSTDEDKLVVLNSFINRCNVYEEDKIINSVLERNKLILSKTVPNNSENWLSWFNNKRKNNFKYSLFIFDYNQDLFIKDNYEINNILSIIADIYDNLENYRYFIFKLNGKLFNKDKEDVTWQILYKVGIYCENFIQYDKPFFPFKQEKATSQLETFLNERFHNPNNKIIAENFYSSISTGFKFEDCFVSENQETIFISMKKIQLDETPVPCPSCFTTEQSGNSYPEVFLRSYECKNPNCPERSKSGRGKRFDEFGVYRYFKLQEDRVENRIQEELYTKWRRDVFDEKNDIYEMLINYYAWDNEKICGNMISEIKNRNNRNLINYEPSNKKSYNTDFENLPICILFSEIGNLLPQNSGNRELTQNLEILNENSTEEINNIREGQVGTAITSPPYYNAREYSQWPNLVLYLIDMMRNCKGIYNVLERDGFYLYNIGDIVNTDNVYVVSNMSKKRLQLGFLSCLIFEKAGFNLVGNIIWDKGEVQSKRNSTMNHNSGYVKCINCYEHVLIFKKGKEKKVLSDLKKITPVIKINSKGVNTYKHTAPYPMELVDLIKPFVKPEKYVLDPFLGSGTTLKWCKKNHVKGIGFEMNRDYFELCLDYINNYEPVINEKDRLDLVREDNDDICSNF
jgi:DNA modification methylase